MPEKRGKILVIRGGAIGDFILTLPALAALRATFPQTHLELLGYPVVAELARAANIIDAFRSIEARPLARFFARNAQLDEEWSGFFDSFNVIVSYLYDPDEIFKTNVGRVSKAQFIQGQHRPNEQEALHATGVFLKPLEQLAIFDSDPIPKLTLGTPAPLSGRWLAAHPGSGSEKKNWPARNWEEFLQRILATTAWNVLLVGGEAEGSRLRDLARALAGDRTRLVLNEPLSTVAGQLAACQTFVGHDSGITHLASALGVPPLILWGPSSDKIWRPLNPKARLLLNAERLAELTVEKVLQEFRDFTE